MYKEHRRKKLHSPHKLSDEISEERNSKFSSKVGYDLQHHSIQVMQRSGSIKYELIY